MPPYQTTILLPYYTCLRTGILYLLDFIKRKCRKIRRLVEGLQYNIEALSCLYRVIISYFSRWLIEQINCQTRFHENRL